MAAMVIFLALTCCSIVLSVYSFAKFFEFKDYFEILKNDNKFYKEQYDSLLNNWGQSVNQIGRLIEYLDKYNEDNYNRFIEAWRDCFDFIELDDFGVVMSESLDDYLCEHIDEVQAVAEEMHFIIPEKNNDSS